MTKRIDRAETPKDKYGRPRFRLDDLEAMQEWLDAMKALQDCSSRLFDTKPVSVLKH